MSALLLVGIGLVIVGVITLVVFPNRPGGEVAGAGIKITSTGAGLPVIGLGVIAVMLSSTIGANQPPPPAPTPTLALLPAVGPTITPTPSLPSPTPGQGTSLTELLLSSTPTRAAAPPRSSAAQVLLRDDFSNLDSGFTRGFTQPGVGGGGYVDGEYQLLVLTTGFGVPVWSSLNRSFDDFRMEIDARMEQATRDGAYGLTFRIQNTNDHYEFLVDPNKGGYSLSKQVFGQTILLANWAPSAAIRRGTIPNHLSVTARGNTIAVAVNGTHLATVTDNTFGRGLIGLVIRSWSDPFVADFANLVVYSAD